MNKKLLILSVISFSTFAFAQDVSTIRNTSTIYDGNSNLGTARYTAMAGSMGALGGDISSLNNNPAGLGVFITGDINAGLLISSNKTTSTLAEQSITKSNDNTKFGHIGSIIAFQTDKDSPWKFINIGVNYSNESIDNNIQTSENTKIQDLYNVYSGHSYEILGNYSKINIGIGANYNNKIFIGTAVKVSTLYLEQYDNTLISSINNPSRARVFNKQDTPFREDASGHSLTVGVIGKINNQLRVGASFESPIWYSVDREYIRYSERNGNISSTKYVESRDLRTPSKVTLSGAFIPNKHFAFNIDYSLDVGKPHFGESGGAGAESQLNDFYQSSYKSRNTVKIGGEYRIKGFSLRGGYGFTTSPFKNHNISYLDDNGIKSVGNISNYIVGKSQVISGGIGYNFNSFYIDATYQHQSQTYSNPFFDGLYVLSGNNGDYFYNKGTSIISDVKAKSNNFVLTLGIKF